MCDGIQTTTFRELIEAGHLQVGDGYRTKQTEHGTPGLPILRVAEVLDGRIAPKLEDFVSNVYRSAMGSKISRADDIVLTTKGTVGRVAVMPQNPEFVYSPQVCFFRVTSTGPLIGKYLYHWFKSDQFWSQARSLKSQTDMADYINLADIKALRIAMPSKAVQQAAVDILGGFDDKIAVNGRTAKGALDLSEARYVQIASLADAVELRKLMDLRYGKALPATRRIIGNVPVFGSGGVVGRHNEAISGGPGIVVGRKGTVGAVYWSERDFFPIDTTFYVQLLKLDLPMEYAFFALKNLGLKEMNSDSAVPGLSRGNALALQVPLPGQDDLRVFHQVARPNFALREALEAESSALARLRDALLNKMMTGEIRVREAERVVEDAT